MKIDLIPGNLYWVKPDNGNSVVVWSEFVIWGDGANLLRADLDTKYPILYVGEYDSKKYPPYDKYCFYEFLGVAYGSATPIFAKFEKNHLRSVVRRLKDGSFDVKQ